MRFGGNVVLFVAISLAAGSVHAQTASPANVPPDSYTDSQFVDNSGCAFVRAGVDGQVSWAPRVSRDREPVCGLEPTFAPAPTKTAMSGAKAKTTPKASSSKKRSASSARAAPAKVKVPASPKSQSASTKHAAFIRVVPVSHKNTRLGSNPLFATPQPPVGYRYAAKGGGVVTNRSDGAGAMNLVWTTKAPHRLIDLTRGIDVTGTYPEITYVAPRGRQKVYRVPVASLSAPTKALPPSQAPTTRSSTKASPAASQTARPHYVQVGTYAVPSNATRTSARLESAGLPVRTVQAKSGRKDYQVVFAGPFTTRAQVRHALDTARKSGYSDAFVRQ